MISFRKTQTDLIFKGFDKLSIILSFQFKAKSECAEDLTDFMNYFV